MDLLEYQAKQLFTQVGIPLLPSQSIRATGELKSLQIPYPVVLKSQVLATERMKYGGVRFVENTIDAIAVAQSLFNLAIQGEYPRVLLAEAQYDAQEELFLSIMIDYARKKPVLMGSAKGGENLDLLLANVQTCIIEEEFSPFYARHLVSKMGLTGDKIAPVADILVRMYDLLIFYDLDLIEINPLAMNQEGEVMALDGKIRMNDNAVQRHFTILDELNLDPSNLQLVNKNSKSVIDFDFHGNTCILTDNIDRAIFMIQSFQQQKVSLQSCHILPVENKVFWQNNIYNLLLKIIQAQTINTIVINHSNEDGFIDIVLEKIESFYKQKNDNLTIDDRASRPTGSRLLNTSTNDQLNPSFNQRKIKWIINQSLVNQVVETSQYDSLPISFSSNIDDCLDFINK